jgi:hypothetical protein
VKPNDIEPCESRTYFWPTIESIAKKFETSLNDEGNKDSVFVQFSLETLKESFEMYERGWFTFKKHTYGENYNEERIDRHKIISLYILSILTKRPFNVRVHPENKDVDKRLFFMANEMFSLVVMLALISLWNEEDKNIYKISESEKKWFILLLNYFKLKFIKSNPQRISDDPSSVTDFLSLAQIVYYIEKSYVNQSQASSGSLKQP